MDRYSFSYDPVNERVEGHLGEEWAPIPEEPRSPGEMSGDYRDDNGEKEQIDNSESDHHGENQQEQIIGQSSSEVTSEQQRQRLSTSDVRTIGPARTTSESTKSINFQSPTNSGPLPHSYTSPSTQSDYTIPPKSNYSTRISTKDTKSNTINLQPDAIYEEHYGDAYVDQLMKYLYPSGYQSMRPRSGPWKLSIVISGLFFWLSVFIVGHCYDRGQEYSTYFGREDDAYLQDVDDDMLVMETRWCGSKLIYFMWFVCVSITMLAMSYCSIIGYIKLRDVAVANGRSQPPDRMRDAGGRSDCYANIENVGNVQDERGSVVSSTSTGYSSYQDGGVGRRYPSIYQSDGTPQFWGGHIYRPTQAAVSMTNR